MRFHFCSKFTFLAVLTLFLQQGSALAEIMYVTDILRLGIHEDRDTADKPFKLLVSGDALDIIEQDAYYARVKTMEGDEGWVKASYLVTEKPSLALLAELNTERENLTSEIASLRTTQTEHDNVLANVRGERDTLLQTVSTTTTEIDALRSEQQTLIDKIDAKKFSVAIPWIILIGIVALAGGFFGGWWWTDARQRARHGGYRV